MAQYEPLYSDRHRSAINFLLIAGVVIAIIGWPSITVLGLGAAAYAWFTTPSSYTLFNDRLLIAYGKPRTRMILFNQIEGVENLQVPLGGQRLRVRQRTGRGAWLTPRDPEAFMDQFRQAMERFQAGSPPEPEPEPPATF